MICVRVSVSTGGITEGELDYQDNIYLVTYHQHSSSSCSTITDTDVFLTTTVFSTASSPSILTLSHVRRKMSEYAHHNDIMHLCSARFDNDHQLV